MGASMKRLICGGLILVALMAGPLSAHAEGASTGASAPTVVRDEDAVKLELARRFIAVMQTDQLGAMIGQMTTSMAPTKDGMSQEESDAMRRAIQRAAGEMMPRMFDAMAPIYADIFTLEELTGLLEFYESDIGRSMMRKSYAAAPRLTEAMTAMMPQLMRDMGNTMCKELSCTAQQRAQMQEAMAQAGYGTPQPSK